MAQHPINVANGSGLDVREGFNKALETLATCHAGPAQPNPIYPYMWWLDTQNSIIKQATVDASEFVRKGVLLANGTVQWDAAEIAAPATGNITAGTVASQLAELDASITDLYTNKAPAFRGGRVYKGSGGNQSIANSSITKITLPNVVFNDGGLWNAALGRFVIPEGVTRVNITGSLYWGAGSGTGYQIMSIRIHKNGSAVSTTHSFITDTTLSIYHTCSTGPLEVVKNDYLELFCDQGSQAGNTKPVLQSLFTNFSMEVLA